MSLFFRFLRVICSYDKCLYIPILCKSAHTARKTFRWIHKRHQRLSDIRGTKVIYEFLEGEFSLFCRCDQKSIKEEMEHELDLNEGEDIGK